MPKNIGFDGEKRDKKEATRTELRRQRDAVEEDHVGRADRRHDLELLLEVLELAAVLELLEHLDGDVLALEKALEDLAGGARAELLEQLELAELDVLALAQVHAGGEVAEPLALGVGGVGGERRRLLGGGGALLGRHGVQRALGAQLLDGAHQLHALAGGGDAELRQHLLAEVGELLVENLLAHEDRKERLETEAGEPVLQLLALGEQRGDLHAALLDGDLVRREAVGRAQVEARAGLEQHRDEVLALQAHGVLQRRLAQLRQHVRVGVVLDQQAHHHQAHLRVEDRLVQRRLAVVVRLVDGGALVDQLLPDALAVGRVVALAEVVQRRVLVVVLHVDAQRLDLEQPVQNHIVGAAHGPVQRRVAELVLDVDLVGQQVARRHDRLDHLVVAELDGLVERREAVAVDRRQVERRLLAVLHQRLDLLVVAGVDAVVERLQRVVLALLPRQLERRRRLLRRALAAVVQRRRRRRRTASASASAAGAGRRRVAARQRADAGGRRDDARRAAAHRRRVVAVRDAARPAGRDRRAHARVQRLHAAGARHARRGAGVRRRRAVDRLVEARVVLEAQVGQELQRRQVGRHRDAVVGERQHLQLDTLRDLGRHRVHLVVVEPQLLEVLERADLARHLGDEILRHREALEVHEPRDRARNLADLVVVDPDALDRRHRQQRRRKDVELVVLDPDLVQVHARHARRKAAARVDRVVRHLELLELRQPVDVGRQRRQTVRLDPQRLERAQRQHFARQLGEAVVRQVQLLQQVQVVDLGRQRRQIHREELQRRVVRIHEARQHLLERLVVLVRHRHCRSTARHRRSRRRARTGRRVGRIDAGQVGSCRDAALCRVLIGHLVRSAQLARSRKRERART